jgi:hypothetical protein
LGPDAFDRDAVHKTFKTLFASSQDGRAVNWKRNAGNINGPVYLTSGIPRFSRAPVFICLGAWLAFEFVFFMFG